MIAIDTSSLVAFLQNEVAEDVELIVDGISKGMIVIPPIVIAEIFCARNITKEAKEWCDHLGVALMQQLSDVIHWWHWVNCKQ